MTEFVCGVISILIYIGLAGGFDWLFNGIKSVGRAVTEGVKTSEASANTGCNVSDVKAGLACSSYGEFTPIDLDPGWETSVGIFGTDGYGDGYGHYGGGFGDGE